MECINLHDRIRIQGDRRFLLIIEHLHLEPCTSQLPSSVGTEVVECLLFLGRAGIKVRSPRIITDTEMNVFRLDPSVSPVEIGNTLNHPTLLGHFSKMFFDTGVIIEGEVF
jgi:hypothetical protein